MEATSPHPAVVRTARRSAHAHDHPARRRAVMGEPAQRAPRHVLIAQCAQLWNYALDLDEDWSPQPVPAFRDAAAAVALTGLATRTDQRRGPDGDQDGPPSFALAIIIAINTAQRPSDICAMRWSQYDGHVIALTQIKTGASVTIPVTEELKSRSTMPSARAQRARLSRSIGWPDRRGEHRQAVVPHLRFCHRLSRSLSSGRHPGDAAIPRSAPHRNHASRRSRCRPHEIAAIGGWSSRYRGQDDGGLRQGELTMAEAADHEARSIPQEAVGRLMEGWKWRRANVLKMKALFPPRLQQTCH